MSGVNILENWLILIIVNVLATISPGPSTVVAVRTGLRFNREKGLWLAAGLGIGVGVYAACVAFGLAFIFEKSGYIYKFIKYAGAGYLVILGIQYLQKSEQNNYVEKELNKNKRRSSRFFYQGLWVTLLNPKTAIFFTAIYSQFILPETPNVVSLLYVSTSILIEILWFGALIMLLTSKKINTGAFKTPRYLNTIFGIVLICIGLSLAWKT